MGKLWLGIIFILSFFRLQAEELKLDPIIFPNAEVVNENTFRIPFKLIDHLMVVEAELLDKKGNFIVDRRCRKSYFGIRWRRKCELCKNGKVIN
ncbi:hypothetical protein [Mesonia maritima]|uniref:Uncharacterized protein n=1 Tax=Mesonia maritima TaxID=1793873 RepID=A0ABU1K9G0_9FLAO|nr:hypothetical protein [Mesonia maritima]MDR6302231.1 hypothetical protein [Mesonia maritima]